MNRDTMPVGLFVATPSYATRYHKTIREQIMTDLPAYLSDSAKVDSAAIKPLPSSRKIYVQGSRPDLDRKSTRLNSSHVRISYAVFCLKKKTKKKTKHDTTYK